MAISQQILANFYIPLAIIVIFAGKIINTGSTVYNGFKLWAEDWLIFRDSRPWLDRSDAISHQQNVKFVSGFRFVWVFGNLTEPNKNFKASVG